MKRQDLRIVLPDSMGNPEFIVRDALAKYLPGITVKVIARSPVEKSFADGRKLTKPIHRRKLSDPPGRTEP